MTRRHALTLLGLGSVAACLPEVEADDEDLLADWDLEVDLATAGETVEALMDVLLPAERDDDGNLLSPGAVEAGAMTVLRLDNFVPLARQQGLLPDSLPGELEDAVQELDPVLEVLIAAELDAMADEIVPYTPFRTLSRGHQSEAVARAYADAVRRPMIELVRGVAFLAYLGAITTDVGLVQIGYAPFESFPDGLAVRGYPRTLPDGTVDDYTFGIAPEPTPGDDLAAVLDAYGDLT